MMISLQKFLTVSTAFSLILLLPPFVQAQSFRGAAPGDASIMTYTFVPVDPAATDGDGETEPLDPILTSTECKMHKYIAELHCDQVIYKKLGSVTVEVGVNADMCVQQLQSKMVPSCVDVSDWCNELTDPTNGPWRGAADAGNGQAGFRNCQVVCFDDSLIV